MLGCLPRKFSPVSLSPRRIGTAPPSVQALVLRQHETITRLVMRVEELEALVEHLKAKLGQDSSNSNRPPSLDSPYHRQMREPKGKGKPGAKPGHKGYRQSLWISPISCGCCPGNTVADAGSLRTSKSSTLINISSLPKSGCRLPILS